MVEAVELVKGNQVTIQVGKATFRPQKEGLYLVDADRQEVKVYEGTIEARLDGTTLELGRGKMATFGGLLVTGKFNRKDTDGLYGWSAKRSGEIAQTNLYVASSLGERRTKPLNTIGGMWTYYPSFGMFTYLPTYGRRIQNPFGWYYYSPYYIWTVYNRVYTPPASAYSAENAGWAGSRPSASAATYSAPAAVAASTGAVMRTQAPAAAPSSSAPSSGGRSR